MVDEQNPDGQNAQAEALDQAVQNAQPLELEALQGKVQSLEEQLAAARDQALRAAAELQNVRRRAEQDVEKAHKFALEKFAGDLLAVVDSLERGLEMSDPNDEGIKPVREGLELTLKMLLDTLKHHQISPIDPQGEPFNPDQHQAMAMEESTELDPNRVLKVFQKGYQLSGRLLRPAMVVVSKAPQK